MKVKTDTKIDVAKPVSQAYTALLETAYQEFLAQKANSSATSDDAPAEPKETSTTKQ